MSAQNTGRPASQTLEQFSSALADQLANQSLRSIAKGSSKSVEWRCTEYRDHTWVAKVYNRTNAKNQTGCPICAGKMVLQGFNDVATTHPGAVELFLDEEESKTHTAFSSKKLEFHCGNPDHSPWTAPISRITKQGSKCPQCSGRVSVVGENDLATTHPELADQLVDQKLRTTLKAGSSSTNVLWKCDNPLHDPWEASPQARTAKGYGCPQCSGRNVVVGVTDIATTNPDLASELLDATLATQISRSHNSTVAWVCNIDSTHVWEATPYNRLRGAGCPVCVNHKVLVGQNDLSTTHPQIAQRLVDPANGTTVTYGTNKKLLWRCDEDPNHRWLAKPGSLMGLRPTGCPECYKNHRSAPERELVKLIKSLLHGEEVLTGDKSLLGEGYELDIVIPGRKVAIEFNGVYWHSEAIVGNNYHKTKNELAAKAGYRLLHVWEDDWYERKEIVLRGLAHRIGVTHNLPLALPGVDSKSTQKIYARKLSVELIEPRIARQFWENNHIQGPVGSTFYLGLVDTDGDVRALLGVGPTNHGSRAKALDGVWDIQRYATRGTVPGGFTRLLKAAEKHLRDSGKNISLWTSYSNDDLSNGGMYLAAGFHVNRRQRPSYFYVGGRTGWSRAHRTHYTRQKFESDPELIYEPGWTEHQAALANKLYRIYDAGKTRWVKEVG